MVNKRESGEREGNRGFGMGKGNRNTGIRERAAVGGVILMHNAQWA